MSEHALLRAFLQRLGSTYEYTQPCVEDRVYQAVRIAPRTATRAAEPVPPSAARPSALAFLAAGTPAPAATAVLEAQPPVSPVARPAAQASPSPNALAFALSAQPGPPAGAPSPEPPSPAAPAPRPAPSALVANPHQAFVAALESKGHRVLTRDGKLFVTNASLLSEEDRAVVKASKASLIPYAESWVETKATSLAQFLNTPLPSSVPVNYTPDEPPDLTGIDEIVLNFATSGLRWWAGDRPVGVTVSTLDGGMTRFLPFAFKEGGNLDEAVVKRWAQEQLKHKKLYGANIRFDAHMSREWGIDLEAQNCTFTDIAHTAALLDDHRRKFALDVLATDFLPNNIAVPRVDESRHHEHHAAEVAEREIYTARLVGRLREVLYPEIDKQDLKRVKELEDSVIPCVVEMEHNAAPIDVPLLKKWRAELKEKTEEGMYRIAREVGFAVNPDSNDDMQRLFQHFNIPFGGVTASGKPSFTDKILRDVNNEYVQLTRQIGKLLSLCAKFIVPYDEAVDADGLLRFNLHQLRSDDKGTVRGRFSASDKNIQQVMNHDTHITSFGSEDYFVRRLFIPGSGLMFSADAAQIEFRLFAHYSGSERLLKAYADDPNVSFHRVAEGILKPYRSDLPYTKVKSMNFLFVYGGGKSHLADYLEVSQSVADEFYGIYHRAFPEVKTLGRKAEALAKSRGYVRSILGRRARFPDPAFAYKALNAVIQPSAADVFKRKCVEVYAERKRTGFVMRMPVHDELVGDVPDQESARMVSEILNRQSFPELKVKILWSSKVGRTWADCK